MSSNILADDATPDQLDPFGLPVSPADLLDPGPDEPLVLTDDQIAELLAGAPTWDAETDSYGTDDRRSGLACSDWDQ